MYFRSIFRMHGHSVYIGGFIPGHLFEFGGMFCLTV